jgi:site-specific recombinase XerD
MRGVRRWLNWLVEQGDLEQSPMAKVKMPRLEKRIPPPFSKEEVQKLLATINRKTELGARQYAICLTLLDTGLRAFEFCDLRISSVNMRTGMAVVLGKGRKQRQIRVGAKARAAILRMLALRGEYAPEDPLWAAYDNNGRQVVGGLSVKGLQTLLHRLGKEAGVMPCAPHKFRRTFAIWCLRAGMDLESLRVLMGHETLVVLQLYLKLVGEDVERAHSAHSPVDKWL